MKYVFLTFISGLLLIMSEAKAQQTYPIYVTPSLTPPYSLTLSDYAQIGSQRLVVTIMVRDVTVTNLPVRLNIRMETTNGVTIETIPAAPVMPIFLTGGEGLALFGDDLKDYFNTNNLQFKGYSKEEYRRTGQLPEGFYRITVEVHHFATGRLISNQGMAMAWMALGKPPVLKTPDDKSELGQINGMPLTFSWLPSNVGTPNNGIQYTFEMWEMRVPGIAPNVIAASMPVFYSTTQMNTSLVIQPAALMLEPGMNYAWRVTASDVMGQVPFAQDGRSEVRTFMYQCHCDSVTNFNVERQGQDVAYRWTPSVNNTSFNVELNNPITGWSKTERVYDDKLHFTSDPDKTYRARVQAICQGNEMNPSDFTSWQTVTVPAPKNPIEDCPECECRDAASELPVTNFELRTNLQQGDTIQTRSGNSIFIIKSVIPQGDGVYKGQFLSWIKIWGVKFLCDYWDLKVNTDNQIVDMNFESVYDPQFLVDVDSTEAYLKHLLDAAAILTTNMTIKDTVKIDVPLTGAYINDEGQLVTVTQDGTETVQPLPGKPDGTLIQGSDGEEYVLTSDGKIMGKEEFANTGGNSRLMDNYNKEREEKAQPSVIFSASPDQIYGFDEYSPVKSNIEDEYPELKAGYRPAFKSVEAYKTDKVLAGDYTNVTYRTEFGVPVLQTGSELTVRGGKGGEETILYAFIKQDTADVIVGKLNILSFAEQTEKICLVSVNGAAIPDKAALEKELNLIYKPAVTNWEVSTGPVLTGITFASEQMTHGGSGILSVYNSDQKQIINAFKKTQKSDDETSYLFFVNNVTGKDEIMGYMPKQYQYGFIYDYQNANNVAHELAHGLFNLPHSFDKPMLVTQNTIDNLMDYKGGNELWKHQWKLIQNPKSSLFKFLQDEEGGELAAFGGITWIGDFLGGLASDAQEKEVEKIQPLLNHVYDNYSDYFEKSKVEDVNITKPENKEWSVRKSSHSGKICKSIYSKFNENKDNTFGLWDKGIYMENYDMEGKSYQVVVFSAQSTVDLKNDKIRLKGYKELANHTYVKSGYTKKYGIIVFYNENKKFQMLLQISGQDSPEKIAEQWLNYLSIVVSSDEQKEYDKTVWDKIKDKISKLFTKEELPKVWGGETKEDIVLDEDGTWWVTQFDEPLFGNETCWQSSCCNRAANKILENAGTSTNNAQKIVVAESTNSDCSGLTGKKTECEEALKIIDKSLKDHKLPIMVGVQHPYPIKDESKKITGWEYKCSGNTPNITNHYIVIRGKKYDTSKKQYYYLFYEVGTSSPTNGKSSDNKLYINNNNNIIEGKTAYDTGYSGNYYIVTEVRKNISQTY